MTSSLIGFLRTFVITAAISLMLGLGFSRADDAKSRQVNLNDGYSLFYDFCKQESQVTLLLLVKTMPPAISDYAKEISSTAKDDMATLTKMGVRDPSLRLDKVSLPSFEVDVRQSMADDRKQQLLWGSSGASFVQALTMTQSETTNYGLHVVKVLSEKEPDAERAQILRHMYDKWLKLHVEAYRLAKG